MWLFVFICFDAESKWLKWLAVMMIMMMAMMLCATYIVLFFVDPSVFDTTTPFLYLNNGEGGKYKDAARTKHFLRFP